jgi:hypothetical protein
MFSSGSVKQLDYSYLFSSAPTSLVCPLADNIGENRVTVRDKYAVTFHNIVQYYILN